MYTLIHQDIVIGFSELESGDPPMGVAFGDFIPNDNINPFEYFKSLPSQGDEYAREIDNEYNFLFMGLNNDFRVFNSQDIEIVGQCLSIEGMESYRLTVLGIDSAVYQNEFPLQCKSYKSMYGNDKTRFDSKIEPNKPIAPNPDDCLANSDNLCVVKTPRWKFWQRDRL